MPSDLLWRTSSILFTGPWQCTQETPRFTWTAWLK